MSAQAPGNFLPSLSQLLELAARLKERIADMEAHLKKRVVIEKARRLHATSWEAQGKELPHTKPLRAASRRCAPSDVRPAPQQAVAIASAAARAAANLEKAREAHSKAEAEFDAAKAGSSIPRAHAALDALWAARERLREAEAASASVGAPPPDTEALAFLRTVAEESLEEARLALEITQLVIGFHPQYCNADDWSIERLNALQAELEEVEAQQETSGAEPPPEYSA